MSKLYEKIAGLLAFVGDSYRKAEGLIQEFYGDSPSFESVRGQVIRPGKKILKESEPVSVNFIGVVIRKNIIY